MVDDHLRRPVSVLHRAVGRTACLVEYSTRRRWLTAVSHPRSVSKSAPGLPSPRSDYSSKIKAAAFWISKPKLASRYPRELVHGGALCSSSSALRSILNHDCCTRTGQRTHPHCGEPHLITQQAPSGDSGGRLQRTSFDSDYASSGLVIPHSRPINVRLHDRVDHAQRQNRVVNQEPKPYLRS